MKQSFVHIGIIRPRVQEDHYDLIGSEEEIIHYQISYPIMAGISSPAIF